MVTLVVMLTADLFSKKKLCPEIVFGIIYLIKFLILGDSAAPLISVLLEISSSITQ